jgi:hypothetical protein
VVKEIEKMHNNQWLPMNFVDLNMDWPM